MVQVVVGGARDFNAMVYGYDRHPGTMQFLENQFTNVSSTLTEAGRSFFSNAKDVFESFTNSDAMRAARNALRKAGGLFQRDEIRSIWELADLQTAKPTMQRYIMAMPEIRRLWQEQRIDGYSNTYVDMYPGTIGENHYDYRRMTNALVQETPDDDEAEYVIKEHIDDLVDGDRELDIDEKADLDYTREVAKAVIDIGIDDPTSEWGGKR